MSLSVYANTPKQPQSEITATSITKTIDLNKADLSTLTGSLKGIGKKRAQAIIDYRESHKGFKSIEELADVKGIGQHFVDVNKDKIKQLYVIK